jgi:hypothetical protein
VRLSTSISARRCGVHRSPRDLSRLRTSANGTAGPTSCVIRARAMAE